MVHQAEECGMRVWFLEPGVCPHEMQVDFDGVIAIERPSLRSLNRIAVKHKWDSSRGWQIDKAIKEIIIICGQ